MDRLIAALLRRLPDRWLEAVNAVSFNLLDQRELIIWENTDPRARWRYVTVRRNTLPAQTAAETTTTTRAGRSSTSSWGLLLLLALLCLWCGRALGRLQCPTVDLQPMPTPSLTNTPTPAPTTRGTLDFSGQSDPETPSPQPVKPLPTKPTPAKPGTHPSPH